MATGRGLSPVIDVSFVATQAKWIRITHTRPQFGRGSGVGGAGPGQGPAGGKPASAPNAPAGPTVAENPSKGVPADATAVPAFGGGPPPSNWTIDDVQLYQPAPIVATPTSQ